MATVTSCSVAIGLVLAGATAEAGAGPPVVFPVTAKEIGTVREGEKLSLEFPVRNESETPLRILRVDLSEPGMRAGFRRVIPPGAEGKIRIEWDTSGILGEVTARAMVSLDDTLMDAHTLTIHGVVRPSIEIRPFPAAFFSVYTDESAERRLAVLNHDERALAITKVEPRGTHFTAELETSKPGRAYELIVTAPAGMEPGRYRETLRLQTDRPDHPLLEVDVNVFVKADLYASPEEVDYGEVSLEQLVQRPELLGFLTQTLILRIRQGEFEIEELSSEIPFLTIAAEPEGKSEAFRLDVGLDLERLERGPIAGSVRIRTDVEGFREVVVPVRGLVL
jgi:hypothetical protein